MVVYDYYRIFYYVAQYKSFTRAAEVLGNNQPNITRCMNNLENELNCQLFVRSNRGVRLTPEGQKLYEHVAIAFEQLQMGEDELRNDRSLESGMVTIGASETTLQLRLLDTLEAFHNQYPHVRLKISNHSTPQAVSALENGLVDFAIVTTPLTSKKDLQIMPLSSFREILIGGHKYRELAKETQTLESIRDIPLISLVANTGSRELYEKYYYQHNLPFHPDMEAATTDQIFPMIKHNLGVGFYPEVLAEEPISRGEIVQIRLAEAVPVRKVCLVYDRTRPQSVAVKKLIAILSRS
jgi:DNA-binding transcriptional LysR family regulator